MNQNDLEKMIKTIIDSMESGSAAAASSSGKMTYENYPLGEKSTELIKTPTGKGYNEVTLEAVLSGDVTADDTRIRPETLEMQAQVAESMGRDSFAMNLRRAAELIPVPDERLLEMYNALRPYRSTKAELLAIADELDSKYSAKISAALVREAAEVGEKRGRLKR